MNWRVFAKLSVPGVAYAKCVIKLMVLAGRCLLSLLKWLVFRTVTPLDPHTMTHLNTHTLQSMEGEGEEKGEWEGK